MDPAIRTLPVGRIDSRTASQGDLFFAIKGERLDGHAFVKAVLSQGAVAAVVSETIPDAQGSLLLVKDTLQALQALAHTGSPRLGQTDRRRHRQRR